MNIKCIEKNVQKSVESNTLVCIHIKGQSRITGMVVCSGDYIDLKNKNFWRIVNKDNVGEWVQTKNIALTRIFSGAYFISIASTKISVLTVNDRSINNDEE